MENLYYTSVVGLGGRKSHARAERAFVERAQTMGYQPVVFNGDDAGTSEFMHVNTRGPVAAISSVEADRALARMRNANPEPFEQRAANVRRIADVLKTLHADFPGMVVNVLARP